jgi:hypothetical protein
MLKIQLSALQQKALPEKGQGDSNKKSFSQIYFFSF